MDMSFKFQVSGFKFQVSSSTLGEVIVVEDRVDGQCVRHVHLMSNAPAPHMAPDGRNLGGEWVKEAGVWHLRASHPFRGALDVHGVCAAGKFRRLVVWSLTPPRPSPNGSPRSQFGEGVYTVREALHDAAHEFERLFGGRAQFGFMRKLPRGAEHGMDVGDLTLFEAEWMLERCVAVGGRR